MKVLKFGGTSVGSPQRMFSVADLIVNEEPKIVVLSAVSGTTNNLVEISNRYKDGNHRGALEIIAKMHEQYSKFIKELYESAFTYKKGEVFINTHFEFLRGLGKKEITLFDEKAILAQGELMSTGLFQLYLEEKNIKSALIPALNYMRLDDEGEPDMKFIEENLSRELAAYPGVNLFITQGYICRNAFGEIDNLKRGGSDYSASLVGAAINASEIQIWTDIDGMHNNDPRYVDKTYPIAELSFDEAAELAYFGAKILHPSSITPAKKKNIPVKLLNTMEPSAKGTVIKEDAAGGYIKAVAAKDGIYAIKIKSGRMLLAYGFLRSVFEVFERYKTPIDMITTSEVAVSLTIDNATHLEEIVNELQAFGTVAVDRDLTIICVVGDFLAEKSGYAVRLFDALKNIPIRMISYGGSMNNISCAIDSSHKIEALRALNDGLFKKSEAAILEK